MFLSQITVANLYLFAFLLGLFFAFGYDLLRFPRILFGGRFSQKVIDLQNRFWKTQTQKKKERKNNLPKNKKVLTFIGDFLYSLFCSICVILLFFSVCSGNIRFMVFPFIMIGFVLYRFTIGKVIPFILEVIALFLRMAVRYLAFAVFYPFRLFFLKLSKPVKRIYRNVKEKIEHQNRVKYTIYMEKLVQNEFFGLLPKKGMTEESIR